MRKGRYCIAVIASLACVWFVSIWLSATPVAREVVSRFGMSVPVKGSSAWRFTEGAAITQFGEYGQNPTMPAGKRNVYLYGDSYIEALQVADECKPDVTLARALGGKNRVLAFGRSGTGLPSFIVHAREYERFFGVPACHVFFVTSVSDDVANDQGDEYAWDDRGVVKCPTKTSAAQLALVRWVNRLHLNVVLSLYQEVQKLRKRRLVLWPREKVAAKQSVKAQLDGKIEQLAAEMRKGISAPCVVLYCPGVPHFQNGQMRFDDPEAEDAMKLKRALNAKGVEWIDASSALVGLYERQGDMARGFANGSGPGAGHLNERGIRCVFGYAAGKLKERYGL